MREGNGPPVKPASTRAANGGGGGDRHARPEKDSRPERDARPARSPEPREVVGVRLHRNGRTFDFDAAGLALRVDDRVVIDDRRGGTLVGIVTLAPARRPVRGSIGRVLRKAEPRDLDRQADEEARLREALAFARERAREHRLPIKVFRIDPSSGRDKTTFYFSSEQRVDFRELVRDLASRLRGRIELRQVGVRDEAKMVGGIGACGRELCCTTFLPQFAPVTIKMAKSQNIALNPTRVTGQCGRLKCCLVYEEAQYAEAGKKLPRVGKRVETPDGVGRVEDLDVLAGKVRVSFPDRPPVTFEAENVRSVSAPGPGATPQRAQGDEPPHDSGDPSGS